MSKNFLMPQKDLNSQHPDPDSGVPPIELCGKIVKLGAFETPTHCCSGNCSNHLSYNSIDVLFRPELKTLCSKGIRSNQLSYRTLYLWKRYESNIWLSHLQCDTLPSELRFQISQRPTQKNKNPQLLFRPGGFCILWKTSTP